MDSTSESDSSSIEMAGLISPGSPSKEQLVRRNESLQQENRVLKMELDTFKVRVRTLVEENKSLKLASVNMLARAEQEEEYISNTLMKQISTLKREKEVLALNYEQEEECLTNDLSRKLSQLVQEKANLAKTLEREQEALVSRLMKKIDKLENDIQAKQHSLEQIRREKIELENTLEQEQESLLNRLWKRMDKLETEKRELQERLDQQVDFSQIDLKGEDSSVLTAYVQKLRNEVAALKIQLSTSQEQYSKTMSQLAKEEKNAKEENLVLQKKLQQEVEVRQALSRHLSESESSLEMEEEKRSTDVPSYFEILRSRTGSSPSLNPPLSSQSSSFSSGPHSSGSLSRETFVPPIVHLQSDGSYAAPSAPVSYDVQHPGSSVKSNPPFDEKFAKPNPPGQQ